MKPSKIAIWLFIALFVCWALGAWTTADYGLRCTKCLAEKFVVEEQVFGIPVTRRSTARGSAAEYQRIFGHPCEHVFRKGGFGSGSHSIFGSAIGCGISAEGGFVRPRMEAVSAAYEAEQRLHDRELTRDTFRLIDTLMPPDIQMKQRAELSEAAQGTLFLLGSFLRRANSVEQWQAVLSSARMGFSDTSNLPTE